MFPQEDFVMRTTTRLAKWIALGLLATANAPAATFAYHGSLQDGGKPAEGKYDLELTLYSAANGGSAIGGPLTMNAVPVQGGNFNTEADFGPQTKIQGDAWLAVSVRPAGSNEGFAPLSERSLVAAAATSSVCPGAWTLQGNAGNPVGSYLGTADTQPLVFDVAGAPVAQFDANQNFAINSIPIDSGTELTVAGSPTGGNYANLFMRQYGVKSGIQLSVGEATSDTANDAALYIDQYDGGTGIADRKRRFAITNHGISTDSGVGINTQAAPYYSGTSLLIGPNSSGPGDVTIGLEASSNHTAYLTQTGGTPGEFLIYAEGGYVMAATNTTVAFNDASASAPQALIVGTGATNGNGAHLTPGGVWTNGSSRTFKEAFAHIDAAAILDKVIALPISTWQYKNDAAEGMHLGPVAEDFRTAFGLGNNERYIATVDEEGVALAAIQGLNSRLLAQTHEKEAEIAELKSALSELNARLSKLETDKGK
jgi:hypothetical protein